MSLKRPMVARLPIRGKDKWGSGAYGSSRRRRDGRRVTHKGVDYACYKGTGVLSVADGKVTKISGYPHDPRNKLKGHLRYVEVVDANGFCARYFYVKAVVRRGQAVKAGDLIGHTQGLAKIYKDIIDHYHFEVKRMSGRFMNPDLYLER